MSIKTIALPPVVVVKFTTFVLAQDAITEVDDILTQRYTRTQRAVVKVTQTAITQTTQ